MNHIRRVRESQGGGGEERETQTRGGRREGTESECDRGRGREKFKRTKERGKKRKTKNKNNIFFPLFFNIFFPLFSSIKIQTDESIQIGLRGSVGEPQRSLCSHMSKDKRPEVKFYSELLSRSSEFSSTISAMSDAKGKQTHDHPQCRKQGPLKYTRCTLVLPAPPSPSLAPLAPFLDSTQKSPKSEVKRLDDRLSALKCIHVTFTEFPHEFASTVIGACIFSNVCMNAGKTLICAEDRE